MGKDNGRGQNLESDTRLKALAPDCRIAVFRALVLGDMLVAVPAFRALRRAFPMARVTLIGLPWAREFAKRFHAYIDDFLEFPGFPELPERETDADQFPHFLIKAQAACFDLAIQMHGSGAVVNALTALFGAKTTAGFYTEGGYRPDRSRYLLYPQDGNEIHRNLKLLEHLGIPAAGDDLEFPPLALDELELMAVPEIHSLRDRNFVCVHPGARLASRRWLAARFAQTTDALAEGGYDIVLTGSKEEFPLVESVAGHMRSPSINLAGRTSLGALSALLRRASLVVTNDTGISHVAAALRVPSVVLVTGSDPVRWAPLDRSKHRAVFHPIPCRPCYYDACPIGQPCAQSITVKDVLNAARSLLAQDKSAWGSAGA